MNKLSHKISKAPKSKVYPLLIEEIQIKTFFNIKLLFKRVKYLMLLSFNYPLETKPDLYHKTNVHIFTL